MSHSTNYIDLTNESDDESRTRGNSHGRPQSRPASNPFYGRPLTSLFRDGMPSPYSVHSTQSNYARQHSSLQHPLPPERKQVSLPTSFHHTTPHNSGSNNEVSKSPMPTQRPNAIWVPPKPRFQKGACINCAETNMACDGEKPCSACVEPGIPCYYPGEKPSIRAFENSIFHPTRPKPLPVPARYDNSSSTMLPGTTARAKSASGLPSHSTKQSDLLPNSLLKAGVSASVPRDLKASADEEVFYDSDESDDDDVPLAIAELEEVKRLLKKHEARMRDHRAYLLEPLLNQAKLDAIGSPEPEAMVKRINPFAGMVTRDKSMGSNGMAKSSLIQVQLKSHKLGAPKKWAQTTVAVRSVKTDSTVLPKYKSIGRLGTSLLAPNIRTLKYWPYFADDEHKESSEGSKNDELEERYQHDDAHLLAQRKCSEIVDVWRPWVKDFVSKLRIEFGDILYWYLHTTEQTGCNTCEREFIAESFTDVSRVLVEPNERSLTLAHLSIIALKEVAKVSMWHFVLGAPSVKDLLKQMDPPKNGIATLCSICFLHNCLTHGSYQEPEEAGGTAIMGGNIEIDDEEANHNIRLPASISNKDYEGLHQCSLYCVGAEVRVKDILGRRKDDNIGGIHNRTIHVPRLTMSNSVSCSEDCFWAVEKRLKFSTVQQVKDYQPKLSEKSKDLFRQLLRLYSDNQRVPCMIAKEIEGLTCLDAFYFLLAETHRISHFRQAVAIAQQGTRKVSKLAAGLDVTLSADLDERPPFVPCSHSGPCLNNPDCTCSQSKVHCEWFCGCEKTCDRRFPGCKCASANKTCFHDKNCECWKHNRECDPWLCGTCGVVEVLDPQNKYKDEIRKGRCKNNRIQLDLPARTIKAPSEVQGWGLYAGIDLAENEFIGEYKGETVGNQESDRRGAVYSNIGQEYLFVMNRDQQIDGSNFGNKTRFINNSQRDDYINVYAKKLLCNGVQRVMLYSKKPILAGEELLYNYNYPVSVTKKFWERGEGPKGASSAVAAKPSITWTQPRVNGRFAKVAGKQDSEQSMVVRTALHESMDDEAAAARRDAKRKRMSEGDLPFAVAGGTAAAKNSGSKEKDVTTTAAMPLLPDDPEDSDFELVGVSESSESIDVAEADSDEEDSATGLRSRRVVHPNDRRRGGMAQTKAWETRRKRNTKGK